MRFILFVILIMCFATGSFSQKNMKFNGQTVKYGNNEVPKSFGSDQNQVLLCVFIDKLDSVEMFEYAPLYSGEVKIISFTEFQTGNYNDIAKYRYVLTEDGYTMTERGSYGTPVRSFTMFCIYDLKEGTKHLHNRDRKLDRYFKKIEKRKVQNTM